MRILIVHNEYGRFSGEEAVVRSLADLLRGQGHEVRAFTRSSADIPSLHLGALRAFFSGIYSHASRKALRHVIQQERPDIIHIHNLFPWISPAILPECRRAGVPVVMTVHNYRLVCPNGLHMPKGR